MSKLSYERFPRGGSSSCRGLQRQTFSAKRMPHVRISSVLNGRGFTLIELIVVLAIFGLLFALGMPSLQAFLRNSQIRNAAEAMSNGLQIARAQAIQRNVLVQFVVTPGTPSSWGVNSIVGGQPVLVQRWSATEGSEATNVATNDDNITATFNGLGRLVSPNPDGTASLTQIDVSSSSTAGTEIRPMRVVVSPSGSIRMCDPSTSLPAGDPRSC